MNSKETLTCNLFHLPQDIFRVIFQYLSVEDLMEGEEAFLNNQELLSLYRSSLAGFTLKEEIAINDKELIPWIIDHKLLVEKLYLYHSRTLEMDILNQFRSSLKSIQFAFIYSYTNNSVPVLPPLGNFPSLTSAGFENSPSFTNDQLLSFFSQNPQLEVVKIKVMDLSNEILPYLSNYCPKIKILSLYGNDWVNDETISLLTEQRLFPNLKSLDISRTKVRNLESLRQFILSHPLLCGLYLPTEIEYSDDFLIFYLRQLIFPSILSIQNSNNDFESHSLAISSLSSFIFRDSLNERYDVVNPEIFSVDILSRLYHKDCSIETLDNLTHIFSHLSNFPTMIDSILQSQFIPFILDYISPDGLDPSCYFINLFFNCGGFHDYFPLLVQKFRSDPSSLDWVYFRAVQDHFSLLTTEQLLTTIVIVLDKLPLEECHDECLTIISKLLQDPSSQHLFDPNTLVSSLKSINFSVFYSIEIMTDCLMKLLSVDENYQQLFIKSNILPRNLKLMDTNSLINFTNHCLSLSRNGLLVDHLVVSGLFQELLSNYSQGSLMAEMESLFKVLIKFKNKKYSKTVKKMKLPNELRVKLFEKRGERQRV